MRGSCRDAKVNEKELPIEFVVNEYTRAKDSVSNKETQDGRVVCNRLCYPLF
jgi:hypothetical protein